MHFTSYADIVCCKESQSISGLIHGAKGVVFHVDMVK